MVTTRGFEPRSTGPNPVAPITNFYFWRVVYYEQAVIVCKWW